MRGASRTDRFSHIPVIPKTKRSITREARQRFLDLHSDRIRRRRRCSRCLLRKPFAEHFLAELVANGFS